MREKKDISDIRRLKFVFNSIDDLEAVFGVFYDRNQQKGITRCQVKGKYKEHMKREFPDIGTVENPSSSDDWDIAKMTIPISVPLGLAGNAQEKANVDVEIMFQLVSDAAADLSAHRPRSHINYVTNREVGIARIANYVNAAVSNVIDNESQDVQ